MHRRITQSWLDRRDTASPLGRRKRPRVEWLEGRPLLSLFVPTISIASTAVTASRSSMTTAEFTVSLSAPAPGTVSVDYATADGTAVSTGANPDYAAAANMLTFAAGQSTETISVPIDAAPVYDVTRTFAVNLSAPVGGVILGGQATGTIKNPNPAPTASISNGVGSPGTGYVGYEESFTISLSAPSAVATTVTYATADGTGADGAMANVNYTPVPPTTVTLGPSRSAPPQLTVSVLVRADPSSQPVLTFSVNLLDAAGATIASGTGTVANTFMYVAEGDQDPVFPTLEVAPSVSASESTTVTALTSGTILATLIVSLSAPLDQAVIVDYATSDGIGPNSAVAGPDYVATSGTLMFPANTTTPRNIEVTINAEPEFAGGTSKQFFVTLGTPSDGNAQIATPRVTVTIVNPNSAPTISISNSTVHAAPNTPVNATFTVSLSAPSLVPLSVNYATADGTAISAGASPDYTAIPTTTLLFPPGTTALPIMVPVDPEPYFDNVNKSFYVNLSGSTGPAIMIAQGTGTIVNANPQPTVSISSVQVLASADNATEVSVELTLSGGSDLATTVNYATADGTAISMGTNPDYTATSGTLSFPIHDQVQVLTLMVAAEPQYFPSRSFTVNLSYPTNATLQNAQATEPIVNTNPEPVITVSSPIVTASADSPTTASFVVSLTSPSDVATTVDYATADGSAVAGTDYTAASGALLFAPGQTEQTISVPIDAETGFATPRTFTLNLSGAVGAVLEPGGAAGTGTILNPNSPPVISISSPTVTALQNASNSLTFMVSLSAPSDLATTLSYTTANGTAQAGLDYVTIPPTSLVIPAGQTEEPITVMIDPAPRYDLAKTFAVNLTLLPGTSATLLVSQGTGTIVNPNTEPEVMLGDATVTALSNSQAAATFTLSLSAASNLPVTVTYATADGTASAGTDYVAIASATQTIAASATRQTINVVIDSVFEYDAVKTFAVNLTAATNAQVLTPSATGTILNPNPPPVVSISSPTVIASPVGPTTATFTVSLSAPSSLPTSVIYSTADGTASAGADYVAIPPTLLTFAPGQTEQTITATVAAAPRYDLAKTFNVDLSAPPGGNGTVNNGQGTATVDNPDPPPTLSVSSPTVTAPAAGQTAANFTDSLSAPSDLATTVTYVTVFGSAVAGTQYLGIPPTTLTFAPGQTEQTGSRQDGVQAEPKPGAPVAELLNPGAVESPERDHRQRHGHRQDRLHRAHPTTGRHPPSAQSEREGVERLAPLVKREGDRPPDRL